MQVIIPTPLRYELIVARQKRVDGEHYRLMTYVVQQPVTDGLLLYNTLTCSLVLLTQDEAADITAQRELIERWFLVPHGHDDRKLCRQIRQMAALLKPAAKAITYYTIFPTTGCNARCFYCFEKGTKPVTMTSETASKVVRYIVAHRGSETVHISWFGGVQITLDGTAQTYNRVKDYVYRDVNAFERVLQNIGLLIAAGIRVKTRLNVGKHNIGEMAELVELLHQRFGADEHLSVYSAGLYDEENNAELFAQRMQLEQQIAAYGFPRKLYDLPKDIRQCHHYLDREFFGHVDSEERDEAILRKFKERRSDIEACATCFYYPQCIRLVMCHRNSICTSVKQQEYLYNTMEAMKYEYERYLKNENE